MREVNRDTRWVLLLILVQLACIPSVLNADVVVLRSGFRFYDVKAEPLGESHRIWLPDGRVRILRNSEIRSVRPGPITWGQPRIPTEKPKTVIQPDAPTATVRPVVPSGGNENRPAPGIGYNWTPILQSAIAPGWGQHSLGREGAASVYAMGSILVLQRYWVFRQRHAAAQREYNDPGPVGAVAAQSTTGALSVSEVTAINLAYLSQKERQVYSLERQGNTMVLAYALLWGWNMLDIVYGGSPWDGGWFRSSDSQVRFVPGLYMQKNSITAGVMIYL